MSIEVFNEQQRIIIDILNSGTQAWVLALNNMGSSRIEVTQNVAMFSTKLLAQGYLDACALPQTIKVGRYDHSYRPDSILWRYNPSWNYDYQGILPCTPWTDYDGLPQDPAPPEGSWDIPEGEGELSEAAKKLMREWKESGVA